MLHPWAAVVLPAVWEGISVLMRFLLPGMSHPFRFMFVVLHIYGRLGIRHR